MSEEKIIARRNRLIEHQKTNLSRFTPLYEIIDENINSINYLISSNKYYEVEIKRLNNIINELEKFILNKRHQYLENNEYWSAELLCYVLEKIKELKEKEDK